jgi:uncharacterized protein
MPPESGRATALLHRLAACHDPAARHRAPSRDTMPTHPVRQLSLFLTESCNLACPYCFASNMEQRHASADVALRALDLLLAGPAPTGPVGVVFWGGEPLLCFDLLHRVVCEAEERAARVGAKLRFALPTNLTLLDDAKAELLVRHRVRPSLSLDGAEPAQSRRRLRGGQSSYPIVLAKLEIVRAHWRGDLPAVRMTVSPDTCADLEHNVRFFLERGFDRVFFAPSVEAAWSPESLARFERAQLGLVDPWARALESGRSWGFVSWDKALARRELRRRGTIARGRGAVCGAGTSMLAVDVRGRVFPCHRFVFYDKGAGSMMLGSVDPRRSGTTAIERPFAFDPSRLHPFGGDCAGCERENDCPVGCPAVNLATCGDVYAVDSRACELARIEGRVVDALERRAGPALRGFIERELLPAYGHAGSPWATSLLGRMGEDAADRVADRAQAALRSLEHVRRGTG